MKVGLIGYGKAGSAVAQVLSEDPRYALQWIATRSGNPASVALGGAGTVAASGRSAPASRFSAGICKRVSGPAR